jgi:hypothetical protein
MEKPERSKKDFLTGILRVFQIPKKPDRECQNPAFVAENPVSEGLHVAFQSAANQGLRFNCFRRRPIFRRL